jgi:hypothetical protein
MHGKTVYLIVEHAAGLELAEGTFTLESVGEGIFLASGDKVVEVSYDVVGRNPYDIVYAVWQGLVPVIGQCPERKLSVV